VSYPSRTSYSISHPYDPESDDEPEIRVKTDCRVCGSETTVMSKAGRRCLNCGFTDRRALGDWGDGQ